MYLIKKKRSLLKLPLHKFDDSVSPGMLSVHTELNVNYLMGVTCVLQI